MSQTTKAARFETMAQRTGLDVERLASTMVELTAGGKVEERLLLAEGVAKVHGIEVALAVNERYCDLMVKFGGWDE